ncbi:glucosaminidase domain-containing protein [Paenibacillus sp. N4]|uniref:glucosaminidase domain-containing protein n=1 Tax=Paenibacillus vietnamensis TaxID=2590547 RepID=UPI001CD05A79|nr:glucosaminidase domain-containing protein [Paenibacillus vietnamensis]MCA0754327.1 glucosaminidase domain-containing protein [Paenibacillus vietnamensis]
MPINNNDPQFTGISGKSAGNAVTARNEVSVQKTIEPQKKTVPVPEAARSTADQDRKSESKTKASPKAPPAEQAQPAKPAEKKLPVYEVTAYYLNVRSEPNAGSRILHVAEQGTAFEIAAVTDNGWLKLKDGGYIHAGYAKKTENNAPEPAAEEPAPKKQKAAVRIASVESSASAPEETRQLPDKPSSRVDSDSGLTMAHIKKIFKGTALSGHGLESAILEIEEEYGINAFFTIAVMKLESGNGKSKLAKNKNNLFGLNAIDGDKYNKAFSFKTKGDSVRRFGKLLSKHYVGKGLETVEQVAKKYCPANSKWPSLVRAIMKSDYKKL